MIEPTNDLQSDLGCVLAMGVTSRERHAIETLAGIFASTGDPSELARQFLNRIRNECKRAGIDPAPIFDALRDDLNARHDGPHTPQEYWALHGDE